jgi:hypothetical protein
LPFFISSKPPTRIKALKPNIIKGCATKFFVINPKAARISTIMPKINLNFLYNETSLLVLLYSRICLYNKKTAKNSTAFANGAYYSVKVRYFPPKYNSGSPSFTCKSVTSPIKRIWSPASTSLYTLQDILANAPFITGSSPNLSN